MSKKPIREIVFGLEDSLVSTFGVLVGMAVSDVDRGYVILSGLIVVAVETVSMAAGAYLSSKADYEIGKTRHAGRYALTNGGYMGISYLAGGVLVTLPYLYWERYLATFISAVLALSTLFLVGAIKGKIAKRNSIKSGLEMSFVSLCAATISYLIGSFSHLLLK